MSSNRDFNESGVTVHPPLPVPAARDGEPRPERRRREPRPERRRGEPRPEGRRSEGHGKLIALLVLALVAGGALVWFIQPIIAPDRRIATAVQRADDAELAARTQKTRADTLEKSLDTAAKGRHDAEAQLAIAQVAQSELAGKSSDEAARRKATEAVQARLKAIAAGPAVIEAGEVHLQIASATLFKPGDDALTDRGKAVLAKVAVALKDLPDRSVWIQGHSDESPAVAKPPPPPPPQAAKKGAKPAPPPPPLPTRVATAWELSAARALAVVHYLQDIAQLDPNRLAALAFGPYAPAATKDKAVNRRLDIVVGAPRGK